MVIIIFCVIVAEVLLPAILRDPESVVYTSVTGQRGKAAAVLGTNSGTLLPYLEKFFGICVDLLWTWSNTIFFSSDPSGSFL